MGIDNIFVLNYLINRQIAKKGGKVIALFVDLRAAFDSMDREELVKAMKGRGVRESGRSSGEGMLCLRPMNNEDKMIPSAAVTA